MTLQCSLQALYIHLMLVGFKGLWPQCITLRITGFLDIIHCLVALETSRKSPRETHRHGIAGYMVMLCHKLRQ
jgi:hypothetical protein